MSKLVITIKPTAYRLKFLTKTVEINQDGGIENLSELLDVDNTDKADSRILAWNETTGKHEYKDENEVGASDWGDIGGTLANQTDLQNALDAKQDAGEASGGGLSQQTLTDAATINIDVSEGNDCYLTIGDDRTINVDSVLQDRLLYLRITQGTGGGFTPVFGSKLTFPYDVIPDIASTEGAQTMYTFKPISSTEYELESISSNV